MHQPVLRKCLFCSVPLLAQRLLHRRLQRRRLAANQCHLQGELLAQLCSGRLPPFVPCSLMTRSGDRSLDGDVVGPDAAKAERLAALQKRLEEWKAQQS